MLNLSSRLYFLLLLVLSTAEPMERAIEVIPLDASQLDSHITRLLNYKSKKWDLCMILIIIWIIGMTVAKLQQIWTIRLRYYGTKHPWSITEVTQLILYWTFIALNIVSYARVLETTKTISDKFSVEPDEDQEMTNTSQSQYPTEIEPPTDSTPYGVRINNTRYEWNQFEPLLVAEAAFAVANVLTFLQLLHCLLVVEFLGPLVVSLSGMMVDVYKFFVLFIFVWVSFAIGLTQLYRTFEALDVELCKTLPEETDCPATPFLSFRHSMWSLFWSLFNPIDLTNLSVGKDLYFTGLVGAFLYATFMLMCVVVLLNALIAMMSNTYTRVEENSEVEWKVARTKLMSEYMPWRMTVPPPFNLVPSVSSIVRFTRFIRQKCSREESAQPSCESQPSSAKDDAYVELSRDLAERCRRKYKMEEVTKAHKSKRQHDVDLLRKAVENMSQEMKDLRQQIKQSSTKNSSLNNNEK